MNELLRLEQVKVEIETRERDITALDLDHLSLNKGELVALVGETGSGKSMTASSIMQLFPTKKAKITKGKILFEGINLLELPIRKLDSIRGRDITMIFQDPMSSLNPVFRIGEPMVRIIQTHLKVSKKEAKERAEQALRFVGLPDPAGMMIRYPHELSGGQRQRVMIAMAMVCEPKLLIADEPTTALDVTIQSQILFLIDKLRKEKGTSVLFITHNLGVVSKIADRIAVMYAGKIVEIGKTTEVFRAPRHPYTHMLLQAIPKIKQLRERLPVIEGRVNSPAEQSGGCRFANRCPRATESCLKHFPDLELVGAQHEVACFYPVETEAIS